MKDTPHINDLTVVSNNAGDGVVGLGTSHHSHAQQHADNQHP